MHFVFNQNVIILKFSAMRNIYMSPDAFEDEYTC